MADPILIDALVHLFRVEDAAVEEAHTNVRELLRSGPRYVTAAYEAYWRECAETIRAVAADETRRCEASVPPDLAAASAGRRRMRQAFEQMFEPEDVKKAKEAEHARAFEQFRADDAKRRAAFKSSRRARGLPVKSTTGEPEPAVLIHGLPEVDYWAGLEETHDNIDLALTARAAAKARQNDANLGDLPLGHSRIGGVPDLPPGVEWPTVDGKKVPFIAQLNLADFPATHRLLPADGHLFVFVLVHNDYAHRPPPTTVFLYRGRTESLVRAVRPMDDDEVFLDAAEDGVYDVLPATATLAPGVEEEPEDAALGHFFGEMQDYYGTPGESAGDALADGDDWIVLLEVGSYDSMQWSDSGSLYLLITRDALARLDFSNVVAAVCSS